MSPLRRRGRWSREASCTFGSRTLTSTYHATLPSRSEASYANSGSHPTTDDGLHPSDGVVYVLGTVGRIPSGKPHGMKPAAVGREAGQAGDQRAKRAGTQPRRRCATQPPRRRLDHVNDTSSTSPMRKTAKDPRQRVPPTRRSQPRGIPAICLRAEARGLLRLSRRTVRRVAPFFDDFRLSPVSCNRTIIRLEWRHEESDQTVRRIVLSDGTLRFMPWRRCCCSPRSTSTVDDPDGRARAGPAPLRPSTLIGVRSSGSRSPTRRR